MDARRVPGLGEAALEAAWAEGRAMSSESAVEYALGDEDKYPSVKELPETANTPARREREVANLVGNGLSNRQISEELEISGRTVEGHVSKVLHKLGLRSRVRISAWVAERKFDAKSGRWNRRVGGSMAPEVRRPAL